MRAECFSAPVRRRYYTSPGSLPHLISWGLFVLALLLPLLLAHGSHGFWPTTNVYREQPRVHLTYDVLSIIEGERADDAGRRRPFRVLANSLPERLQRLQQPGFRASQIKAYERDSNRDGLPDSLHVRIAIPLNDGETVLQVKTAVVLNVTFQAHVRMNMDALAVLLTSSPVPGAVLRADGDLDLEMRAPLHVRTSQLRPFASSPLLNLSRIHAADDLDLHEVISRYRERDVAILYSVPYPLWSTDAGPQALARPTTRKFEIDLTIRVPSMNVLYRPTWGELLKTAWIQYASLLAIIYGIVNGVSSVLFRNKVLDTYSRLDDPSVLTTKRAS